MKSRILAMTVLAATSVMSDAKGSSRKDASENARPVSMVNILVFPEKYLEEKIEVGGYVMFYDGWRIFLTCEHAHQN